MRKFARSLALVGALFLALPFPGRAGEPVPGAGAGTAEPVAVPEGTPGTRLRERILERASGKIASTDPVASLTGLPGASGLGIEGTRLLLATAIQVLRESPGYHRTATFPSPAEATAAALRGHLDGLEREHCDARDEEARASSARWSPDRLELGLERLGEHLEAHRDLAALRERVAELERILPRLEEERAAFRKEVLEQLPEVQDLFSKQCGWLGPCQAPTRQEVTAAAISAVIRNPLKALKMLPMLARWRRIQEASPTLLTQKRLEVVGAEKKLRSLKTLDPFAPLAPCRWR